jgi:uncharacterized membrane protein YbhN (UPF0104 family)
MQALASLAVLVLLLREARPAEVWSALQRASLGWLALAFAVKAAALTLHELRLWWLLRAGASCSLRAVIGIGFVSGLINMILPIRAGDLVAMMLLAREQRVPGPVAVSAVFLVALLEAAALGVFLLLIFGVGALFWEQALGTTGARSALSTVSIATLAGVVLVLGLGLAGRLLGGRRAPGAGEPSPLGALRTALSMALEHSAGSVGRAAALATNAGLALLDAGLFLCSYAILVKALGLPVASPWMAAGAVMALSAVASLVLPPSMGAGTAASSVFALGLLGVPEAPAIAFAALVWLVGTMTALTLGLPPALSRVGGLVDLIAKGRTRLERDPPTG